MREFGFSIFSKINSFLSMIITFLTSVFGMQWSLFVAYLLLNVLDYITGIIKAKKNKKESSNTGITGIMKKVCYWLVIMTSFIISYILIEICSNLGINIEFIMFFGWFTLACFAINEVRSILENLIEIGIEVPKFLVRGLEIAEEKIENIIDEKIDSNSNDKSIIEK